MFGQVGDADTQSLAEVLLYDRALDEDEVDAILEYLGRKWGSQAP